MSDRYICKAKRTDNGEWVNGCLLISDERYFIVPNFGVSCIEELGNRATDKLITLYAFEVILETVCQCTGLPDKDKAPMYENDIVRASGGVRGVIKFRKYGDMKTDYGFYIEWDKTQPYWRNDICYWQNEIKVIGSYIDNPELLEGGAE